MKHNRLVAALIIVAIVVVPLLALATTVSAGQGQPKVWVCKYVGTPGVSERLKAGKNPIEVSNRAAGLEVGDEFSDRHGRSVVVQVGGEDPGRQACDPTPPPPPPDPIFDPAASFLVCGDPRLLLTLDNSESTIPAIFQVRFTNALGVPRFVTKWVDAGETDRLLRHVKGRSYLHIGAKQGLANEILFAGRLPRTTPWGTGVCSSFDGLGSARAWANS